MSGHDIRIVRATPGDVIRIVRATHGDVIITMNKTRLLKFIGWVEAHRTALDSEPGWLGYCLGELESAREGDKLDATITVMCAMCGAKHEQGSAGIYYEWDAGEWFCTDRGECAKRETAAEVTS